METLVRFFLRLERLMRVYWILEMDSDDLVNFEEGIALGFLLQKYYSAAWKVLRMRYAGNMAAYDRKRLELVNWMKGVKRKLAWDTLLD